MTAPTGSPWTCPRWCSGDHAEGRHTRLVGVVVLGPDDLLAVALVQQPAAEEPCLELIRDRGNAGRLDVIRLMPRESATLAETIAAGLQLLGWRLQVDDPEPAVEVGR